MSAEKEAAQQWLHYAEGDLLSAKVLAASTDLPPRNACYLAQQCVEKTLKAVLILAGTELIRTHDLDALAQRMPEEWRESLNDYDLSWLSEWCIEARYPGDWPEATSEDAIMAVKMADDIYCRVVSSIPSA